MLKTTTNINTIGYLNFSLIINISPYLASSRTLPLVYDLK
jgi:hypothetical protein